MRRSLTMSLSVLVVLALSSTTAFGELSDPYEILNSHYEAIGGLEKLRAQTTSHMETDLSLTLRDLYN